MKPRVLLVNKFYYRRGGDCVCVLNLEELLRARGHEVAVFAMHYPENLPSPWERYWASEVEFGGGVGSKLNAMARTMGFGSVCSRFRRIIRDFRPDVVHIHNIHSYLSPVVAKIARKAGIKVVWTLHDYKLLCPSYACLRDGSPCELCFDRKSRVLATRCMKGSLAASAVAYAEALRWNQAALTRMTSRFICPSRFMMEKMAQGGFPQDKLTVLCNFLAPEMASRMQRHAVGSYSREREPYYCYVGRLSAEKGVETLLQAASGLPYELRVAGDGPLARELREKYSHCDNIRFLGRLDSEGVEKLLASARLSVLPSECYENNPLGVIESLCCGTPVVGAQIGGIPELIGEKTGITYPSGDVEALRSAIRRAWTTAFDHESIAADSLVRFSATAYYEALCAIYAGEN